MTKFEEEALIAISKANTLGFNFKIENKLSKTTWGYVDNINSVLIDTIMYKLLRIGSALNPVWVIYSYTTYKFNTDKNNGIHLVNINKLPYNQTEIKEHFVCSIEL